MTDAGNANRLGALAELGGQNFYKEARVGDNGNQFNAPIILQRFDPKVLGQSLVSRWPFLRSRQSSYGSLMIGLATQLIVLASVGGIIAVIIHFSRGQSESR